MWSKEDFEKEIKALLKEAVAGVSEEARLEKVKALLETANTTISELLETVELKDQEIAQVVEEKKNLSEQIEELRVKTTEMEERFAAQEAEYKQALERTVTAEGELAKISLDRRLETRVSELAEAKILKAAEKLEIQKIKVRDMSDEEFASYKEELVDLRLSIEAALQEKATEEAEVETGEVEIAPPAINKDEAAVVEINVEDKNRVSLKERASLLMSELLKLQKQ